MLLVVMFGLVILSSFEIFDKAFVDLREETRVKTIICKEGRYLSRYLGGFVGEFSKRRQIQPVVLFIVAKDTKVSLESLIHSSCLTVSLRMEM